MTKIILQMYIYRIHYLFLWKMKESYKLYV